MDGNGCFYIAITCSYTKSPPKVTYQALKQISSLLIQKVSEEFGWSSRSRAAHVHDDAVALRWRSIWDLRDALANAVG